MSDPLPTDSLFGNVVVDSSVSDTSRVVKNLTNNTRYWWRVQARNAAGWGPWSAAGVFIVRIPLVGVAPREYRFSFTGMGVGGGVIRYALPKPSQVRIRIYNIHGKLIKPLADSYHEAGYYQIPLRLDGLSKGFYVFTFTAGSRVIRRTLSNF